MAETRTAPAFAPRALQLELRRELKRFSVLVAHRRFGKTVFTVNELLRRAAAPGPPARPALCLCGAAALPGQGGGGTI